jgi:hypothetical protein
MQDETQRLVHAPSVQAVMQQFGLSAEVSKPSTRACSCHGLVLRCHA